MLDKDYNYKLIDFGHACYLGKNHGNNNNQKYCKLSDFDIGSESYKAPEMNLELEYDGTTIDLFADAVTLFMMVFCQRPFKQATKYDPRYKMIVQDKYNNLGYAEHPKAIQ